MIDIVQLIAWFLVFIRLTSFLVTSPVFSFTTVPGTVKVGLSIFMAVAVFPNIDLANFTVPGNVLLFVIAVLGEIAIGMMLGFASSIVFNAIRTAGQYIDMQIGYMMANVFDPLSGSQNTVVGQYLYYLSLLLFLTVDGHHIILLAIMNSFHLLPINEVLIGSAVIEYMIKLIITALTVAIQVAAPIQAVMITIDMALGVLGRTVPQMNIFMLSFPIKTMVGLLVLSLILPIFANVFNHLYAGIEKDLLILLRSMS